MYPTRNNHTSTYIIFVAISVTAFFAWLMLSSPVFIVNFIQNDTFISIDVALRAALGQTPHIDFSTPLGTGYYLVHQWAALLVPPPRSVTMASAIICGLVILGLVVVGRDRLPASILGLLIVYTGLWILAPGFSERLPAITHLASYNRWGWGIFCLILITSLIPPAHVCRQTIVRDAAIIGLSLLALAFIKITFALTAGLLVLAAMALQPANRRSLLIAAVGSGLLTLIIVASVPSERAYVNDLWTTLQSSAPLESGRNPGFSKLWADVKYAALPLIVLFITGVTVARGAASRQAKHTILLSVVAGCVASLIASNQSFDRTFVAGPFLGSIAVWHWLCHQPPKTQRIWRQNVLAALCIVLFLGAQQGLGNAWTIQSYHALSTTADDSLLPDPGGRKDMGYKKFATNTAQEFLAGKSDKFVSATAADVINASEFRTIVEDGMNAVRLYGSSTSTVFELLPIYAINYSLGRRPPKHVLQWWDEGRTFNDVTLPPPETTFSDIDTVLQAKFRLRGPEASLDHYLPYIHKHFTKTGETPLWEVWVKNEAL